ncbi:ABC transporter permease [Arthrobacter mangrovi]|uniref:Iron ABC transporter permease n=1 Tax=Arthrobacter mangrovi TaxID=2966350 RepID=A0ABQ5MXD4_9MICC|nr:iron ABC transporter permease [Arthrobacter mangrovi]GLB68614.1 iron ABC transporter permease [Arthrobacter mangrovi]
MTPATGMSSDPSNIRSKARSPRSRPPAPVVAAAVVISLATLIPLGFVIIMTAATGWDTAVKLIFRPRVGELLFNTVGLVLATIPLCIVIGVAAAWLVERTQLPGARFWSLVLAAPLAVPAFVNSYAWVSTIPSLGGIAGGTLVSVLSYYPLVYIPAAAALRRMDPALEQSAASLGLDRWRAFFRVILPQLWLPITGGSLLVGLHLLAEFGAFSMIRFNTFTTAIMEQYQSTFNGVAANMLASVLVLLCLVMLLFESRIRGNARYARIGSGVASRPPILPLGRYRPVAVVGVLGLAALALGVPLGNVVRWLVAGGADIWDLPEIARTLAQTLAFGLAGALLTVLLAFPIAWLAVRYPSWFTKLLEGTNYITSSLPGIVVALAFVTVAVGYLRPLYQTVPLVIAAYVLLFLPRALVNLRAGLAQAPRELEEAAQSLGNPPLKTFLRVTLRLTAPAAAGGAALVFLGIANELTATLLLAPTGVNTLATRFWSLSSEIDYGGAAPYALILILLSLPMTYLLYTQSQKAAGQ